VFVWPHNNTIQAKDSTIFRYAASNEDIRSSGDLTPPILNLGTRCRFAVRFMYLAPYSRGRKPKVAIDLKVGWASVLILVIWRKTKYLSYVYSFVVKFMYILLFLCIYCYIYVFLFLCMFCSVYSVFILPTGIHSATLTEFFPCFFLSCKVNARV
jgi:hypothetical protein